MTILAVSAYNLTNVYGLAIGEGEHKLTVDIYLCFCYGNAVFTVVSVRACRAVSALDITKVDGGSVSKSDYKIVVIKTYISYADSVLAVNTILAVLAVSSILAVCADDLAYIDS